MYLWIFLLMFSIIHNLTIIKYIFIDFSLSIEEKIFFKSNIVYHVRQNVK